MAKYKVEFNGELEDEVFNQKKTQKNMHYICVVVQRKVLPYYICQIQEIMTKMIMMMTMKL